MTGTALNLLLMQRGGRLDTAPGNDISVTMGGHQVKPLSLSPALKAGRICAEAWSKQGAGLGIAGVDLSTVVPHAANRADENRER